MKNIPNSIYDRIENYNKNEFYKIGYYDNDKNEFREVARFRNSYNSTSGTNYGLLQIWANTFDVNYYETQGGYNKAGGYDKKDANLTGCLYQLKCDIEDNKIMTDCGKLEYSPCASVSLHIEELKDYLQKQYTVKLFVVCCNG